MRIRAILVTCLASSVLWTAPAFAQQVHVVDPAGLRQAIAAQAATDQRNRDAVLGVLRRADVRELAGRLGLSVTSAERAVATLSSTELAGLAAPARAAEVQLAGGADPIVLSLTTVLLIVIAVLLIAR